LRRRRRRTRRLTRSSSCNSSINLSCCNCVVVVVVVVCRARKWLAWLTVAGCRDASEDHRLYCVEMARNGHASAARRTACKLYRAVARASSRRAVDRFASLFCRRRFITFPPYRPGYSNAGQRRFTVPAGRAAWKLFYYQNHWNWLSGRLDVGKAVSRSHTLWSVNELPITVQLLYIYVIICFSSVIFLLFLWRIWRAYFALR